MARVSLVALVVTGCSAPAQDATSQATLQVDEPVAEALGVPVEDAAIAEPERPELLGPGRPDGGPTPQSDPVDPPFDIPFLDEAVASAGIEPTPDPASATETAAADAGANEQPVGALTDAPAASLADALAPSEELTGTSQRDDEAAREPLPLPAPAAGGEIPGYLDPSEQLVVASGRPFVLGEPDASAETARTIDVSGMVSETLATLPYRVQGCLGAQARFGQANEHNELTRTVTFDGCVDDEGLANLANEEAEALADTSIFAAAPLNTPALTDAASLVQAGIPYVGTDALPIYCGRQTAWGFNPFGALGCPILEARGYSLLTHPVLTAYLEANDDKEPKMLYLVADSPAGRSTGAARQFEAELLGLEPLAVLAVLPPVSSAEPTSWEPVVDDVLEAKPETVFVDGVTSLSLSQALRKAGFKGEVVLVGQFDPPMIADADARKGIGRATIVSLGLDVADHSTSGWQAIESAAASVGVPASEIGIDFVRGYLAADFLVQAIAATPEPLTAARVVATINSGWWYPGVAGVLCGSWWPAGHLVPSPCVSVAKIDVSRDAMDPVLGLVSTRPQLRFELQ